MMKTDEDGVLRIGMVIGIKQDCIDHYRALHDGPGVRDLLQAHNIFNFNIFLQKMPDGQFYEFAYYEYRGRDYDADLAKLAREPRNIAWLKQTDATQTPLDGHASWAIMERIFFNS
jgi:L-rhamnose mutarotase